MRRSGAAVVIAILMLVTGCDIQQDISARADVGGTNPSAAPAVSGSLLRNASLGSGPGSFNLASEHGHAVVIDFWGSWCGPCRGEQPDLNALANQWLPKGVVFVGIAVRDDPASVQAYLNAQNVPYPSLVDTNETLAAAFDVASPPTTVVVSPDGKLVGRYLGTIVGISSQLAQLTGST